MSDCVGFFACHPEGPLADLTREALAHALFEYWRKYARQFESKAGFAELLLGEPRGWEAIAEAPDDLLGRLEYIGIGHKGVQTFARHLCKSGAGFLETLTLRDIWGVWCFSTGALEGSTRRTYPPLDPGWMRKAWFYELSERIEQRSTQAGELWSAMLCGRAERDWLGGKEGVGWTPDDSGNRSFWTAEECRLLASELPALRPMLDPNDEDDEKGASVLDHTLDVLRFATEHGLGLCTHAV